MIFGPFEGVFQGNLGDLGPCLGPVDHRPEGFRAFGRLDRAGYPAWPFTALETSDRNVKTG